MYLLYVGIAHIVIVNPIVIYGQQVQDINNQEGIVNFSFTKKLKFQPNDIACIINEQNKAIACGKITNLDNSLKHGSIFISDKNKLSKIQVGMKIKFKQAQQASTIKSKKDIPKKVTKRKIKIHNTNYKIWLFTSSALMSPSQYNVIAYSPPKSQDSALWSSDKAQTRSFMGFALRLAIPFVKLRFLWAKEPIMFLGFKMYGKTQAESTGTYSLLNPEIEAVTSMESSATSIWLDTAIKDWVFNSNFKIIMLSGIDYYSSSLKFTATTNNQNFQDIADGSSSLKVYSLRFGSQLQYNFNPRSTYQLGVALETNILLPLMSQNSFSVKINDMNSTDNVRTQEQIKNALNHKKSSLGLEINIGTFIMF